MTLRANRSGGIDAYTGVSTMGQSSETAFAQVVSEVFGIDYDLVTVQAGDTGASPLNTGAFASRTLIAASGALKEAAEKLADKTRRLAAWRLDVEAGDLEIAGRVVRHRERPDEQVPLAEVFGIAITGQGIPPDEEPGLETTSHFEPSDAAYSFGTAAAKVGVDPQTGEFDVERFVLVHDAGTVVNPTVVEGQIRGALAQGFGAALTEELRYDPDTGQLVNGSLVDYFPPTAADLPPIELLHTEVPSPVTPFGVRGVGEAGTIPPGAAVANAICDASPSTVWSLTHCRSALRASGGRSRAALRKPTSHVPPAPRSSRRRAWLLIRTGRDRAGTNPRGQRRPLDPVGIAAPHDRANLEHTKFRWLGEALTVRSGTERLLDGALALSAPCGPSAGRSVRPNDGPKSLATG